jgi:SAM-dependent methyltransferase
VPRTSKATVREADSSRKTENWEGHSGTVLDSVNGYDVIECTTCGFKHVVPVPTADQLEDIYKDEYYSTEKPLYFERSEEDLDWWNLAYHDLYDIFERHLPGKRRRILDIGSGPGYFLLHGKQRGWQTQGIEPSKQAAAYGRSLGLDIVEDFLDSRTVGELGAFDVVFMQDVLEHAPNPREMLGLACSIINPKGLLCVVVPNDYNPFQFALRTVCGHEPWWVSPPYHINYFEFDSLTRLLEDFSLEIVSVRATFPIDMFLLMGDNYVGNDGLGRECHAKRKAFEFNLAEAGLSSLKHSLYETFAEMGIGREAIVIGLKK